MTNSSFLLRLKPWRAVVPFLQQVAQGSSAQDLAKLEAKLKDHPVGTLLTYSQKLEKWFEQVKKKDAYGVSEHVYLPSGGLFAEAILGRSNAAEVIDITRYFNWQDSPIPNPAPVLQPVGTESRYQTPPQTAVTVPPNSINLVNPVNFPDPTGLKEVLTAVRTGDMFRDMSKAEQLTTILGGLATLAGKMGEVSAKMTGDAAQQAMKSAGDIGKAVSEMASNLGQQGLQQLGSAPASLTEKGGTVNELRKQLDKGPELDQKVEETLGLPPPPDASAQVPSTGGGGADSGNGTPVPLPSVLKAITQPGQVHEIEPSEGAWQQASKPWQDKFTDLTTGPGGVPVQPTTEQLVAHAVGMFNELVLPDLKSAASDDRLLAQAVFQWQQWKAHTQQIGVGGETEIGVAEEQARIWAVGGLRNAVQLASDRAVASNDWHYLLDALGWSAEAQHLALDQPVNRLHNDYVLEDFPLRVEILEAQFPQTLGPDQSATLAFKAGLRIKDNPPILNEPLAWKIQAEGGSVTGPGNGITNSSGSFAMVVTRSSDAALRITAKVDFMLDGVTLYSAERSQEVGLLT